MECCGRRANMLELQVAGQPFALHRCTSCGTNYWTHDGVRVSPDYVTKALQAETDAKARAKAARA